MKAAVMQAEMEAELEKLSTQILQILSQQEEQKKHWFRWGVGAGFIGVVLSIVSLIIAVITAAGPTPPVAYILGLAVPQLLVLAGAFTSAATSPEGTIGLRLKWAWSQS
jgi:heme/copper-type cytochrome/quinol oxidase subunit 4